MRIQSSVNQFGVHPWRQIRFIKRKYGKTEEVDISEEEAYHRQELWVFEICFLHYDKASPELASIANVCAVCVFVCVPPHSLCTCNTYDAANKHTNICYLIL